MDDELNQWVVAFYSPAADETWQYIVDACEQMTGEDVERVARKIAHTSGDANGDASLVVTAHLVADTPTH